MDSQAVCATTSARADWISNYSSTNEAINPPNTLLSISIISAGTICTQKVSTEKAEIKIEYGVAKNNMWRKGNF
jgi:hypothetical protein